MFGQIGVFLILRPSLPLLAFVVLCYPPHKIQQIEQTSIQITISIALIFSFQFSPASLYGSNAFSQERENTATEFLFSTLDAIFLFLKKKTRDKKGSGK